MKVKDIWTNKEITLLPIDSVVELNINLLLKDTGSILPILKYKIKDYEYICGLDFYMYHLVSIENHEQPLTMKLNHNSLLDCLVS